MQRYINPYTDFAFKKIFGEPANKDLLSDFLNTLLPEQHQIKTLEFRNPDLLGVSASDRRAVFDIFCENEKQEPFIVEMQKAEQGYFKDRSVYYTALPIRDQAPKGPWNFMLKPVYFIGILNFLYDKADTDPVLVRTVNLKDQYGKPFYEKLNFIYVQMPVFKKTMEELETHQDKWLYFLKDLPDLNDIPAIMNEPVFQKAFQVAELAAMNKTEREVYEKDLNDYWTYLASLETAEQKGIAKGRTEGEIQKALKIARNMKDLGIDSATIARATELSAEKIANL